MKIAVNSILEEIEPENGYKRYRQIGIEVHIRTDISEEQRQVIDCVKSLLNEPEEKQ